MTESKDAILARFPENPLEVAIQAAMAKPGAVDEMKAFYRALYDAEIIIPLAGDGPDVDVPQDSLGDTSLGFLSATLDGVEHAVLFSSVSQMHLAFPNGCRYTRIKMSRLCSVWPDAPAALNPPGLGCPLSSDEIRGLPIGPMAARTPLAEESLRQAEANLDRIFTFMFREKADQVVLSPLGIHFFKASQMVLVGKLGVPLAAMLRCLRVRGEIRPNRQDGLVAAVGTDHPLELLRLDMMAGEDGAEGALIRRSTGKNTWPRPMLPATYRLAA
jgi:hypothetical protein